MAPNLNLFGAIFYEEKAFGHHFGILMHFACSPIQLFHQSYMNKQGGCAKSFDTPAHLYD